MKIQESEVRSERKYKSHLLFLNFKRRINKLFITKDKIYSRITPYAGTSSFFGKNEIVNFIGTTFSDTSIRILDVGPGQGIYNRLLRGRGYHNIDAVEIYKPYIDAFRLSEMYAIVYNENIVKFEYDSYDLVLFGDVLEHLKVKDAQRVIQYAQDHSKLVIVSIPYRDQQIGQQLDGSGDHQQSDLTKDIFHERYPNFKLLVENEGVGVFHSINKKLNL